MKRKSRRSDKFNTSFSNRTAFTSQPKNKMTNKPREGEQSL
ncbi:hypothetical protein AB1L05_20830 [Cytobacillus horneckiae]